MTDGLDGAHLKLHNVRVHRTFPVIQKLPGNDSLAGAAPAFDELDGHLLICLRVHCQLHKPRRATAKTVGKV